ncbi:5-oxoprolinase [Ischnura elegans]|uniref:5-oxoprolinase n=1 Tax=Ischnura elegans TaxID=197161 RepID=UPI001ED88C64|nr:5-oxoprolinase [Ischnura elegans]
MDCDNSDKKFKFAIDRGGTFTDVYSKCPGGKVRVMKLLSVDPANYSDAPTEGIRRILEEETGKKIPPGEPIDASQIEWIRMGTTVATNALLERKGERVALVINHGFRDLLYIGNQARPRIFDLEISTPEVLYEEVVEVHGRVIPAEGGTRGSNSFGSDSCVPGSDTWKCIRGSTGEEFLVTEELRLDLLRDELIKVKGKGINSLSVVLLHSYAYAEHELMVGELAKELGFSHVSLSHKITAMVRVVPRGFTACADAYLTPHVQKYVHSFASGFKDNLKGTSILFMQSDGGLTPMDHFNGSRAVLSGPAGGVVGYAITTTDFMSNSDGKPPPVIGFDMGGTSTDVSRFAGEYEHVFESTTAGVTIQAPQLDINTVAAGGGSILTFRSGLFAVGPESSGADPGPSCYRKGGPASVTDANLVLGRLLPEFFPCIFGPGENEPLDMSASREAIGKIRDEVNSFIKSQGGGEQKTMSIEEVAMGFIRVANEAMCRPIRALTQAKGYDTSHHILAVFGGAGGQHACAIARSLGMSTVFVHRYAGILSAYGMALADVVHETQEPCAKVYSSGSFPYLEKHLDDLTQECQKELISQGFSKSEIVTEPYLHMRYEGTDCALMCSPVSIEGNQKSCGKYGNFEETFLSRYKREFGFTIPDRPIIVDDVRVRGVGKSSICKANIIKPGDGPPPVEMVTQVYFEQSNAHMDTPVYLLNKLGAGHKLTGPSIIMDGLSTVLVEPGCEGEVTHSGDMKITIGGAISPLSIHKTGLDSIQLSIFSHRFMSIAEQMGRILQRTSISTNIKERLDFSCALFGPDGGLVSNAPHIPVHLGAMQETVQYQMKVLGEDIHKGDVILANHPCAGGSHLPDLTVITPVFYKGEERPVFFVASRGHHADIGGSTPGSMPPHSHSLLEEGAAFKSFKIVERGAFREKELIEALTTVPQGAPQGCSGTRNLHDNLSDLRAQIAANQKGIYLVCELIDVYGLDVVQAYMKFIQENAELAVRDMLKEIARRKKKERGVDDKGLCLLEANDFLDDGSPIKLNVSLNSEEGSATFDFSGTGFEVWGNCNAPKAITLSAIIYCLRCMVGHDVPLNQGCLTPVKVITPKGSLLCPSDNAAVVGGNVLTSQRVVDVVLRALDAGAAASQGCMNNVTLGDENWGYYETVAGGAGAGHSWHGRSGVHTHMTNTRITDTEILERRYPVVVRKFQLRDDPDAFFGGEGKYRGGLGVTRELLFRRPATLSVLTERRVFSPYGLKGGRDGAKGVNLLIKAEDGRTVYLGSKTAVTVSPGDVFRMLTPGGGGYGEPNPDASAVKRGWKAEGRRGGASFEERGSVFEYRRAQESV